MSLVNFRKVNPDKTHFYTIQESTMSNGEKLVLEGRIASTRHNKPFDNARREILAQHQNADEAEQIVLFVNEVHPHHVFVGWNLVDENGQPVPYSPEKCKEVLDIDYYTCIDIFTAFNSPANFRELSADSGAELGNASSTG